MEISIQQVERASVVQLPQRMVLAGAAELRNTIRNHIEGACPRVVLDMSGVEFVDSSGLSVLVSALKAARAAQGDVVLLDPTEPVMALILLTRMHEMFEICRSLDAALEVFQAEEGAAA